MPRGLFHKFRCFRPVASPSAWAIGASLRGSRTRQAGLCLPAGGMARLAHMVNDVLAESGAFELGGVIRELLSGRFLPGETVERTQAPDQAGRVVANHWPAGEAVSHQWHWRGVRLRVVPAMHCAVSVPVVLQRMRVSSRLGLAKLLRAQCVGE